MARLIALTGYAGTGKDTAADALEHQGYARVAFADPLKDMLCALLRCTREQLEDRAFKEQPHPVLGGKTPRYAMQTLGTEWGRKLISEDIWVDAAMRRVGHGVPTVFTDCRFENEAEAVRAGGGQVVRVIRPGVGPVNEHVSDAGVSDELVDVMLVNDGEIADLHEQIANNEPGWWDR